MEITQSQFKPAVPEKSAWVATSSSVYGNDSRYVPAKVHDGILDNGKDTFHSEKGPFQWLQVDFGRTVQVGRHDFAARYKRVIGQQTFKSLISQCMLHTRLPACIIIDGILRSSGRKSD